MSRCSSRWSAEHLLLASVATSRDLTDPVTIDTVVAAVGDRSSLELLAALTKADSLATSDTLWTTLEGRADRRSRAPRRRSVAWRVGPAWRSTTRWQRRRELVERAAGQVLDRGRRQHGRRRGARPAGLAGGHRRSARVAGAERAERRGDHRGRSRGGLVHDSAVFDRDPDWETFSDELGVALRRWRGPRGPGRGAGAPVPPESERGAALRIRLCSCTSAARRMRRWSRSAHRMTSACCSASRGR